MEKRKKYICIYLRPPIWAKSEPDWNRLKLFQCSLEELVSETVFINDDLGISIQRDGLILVDTARLWNLFNSRCKIRGVYLKGNIFTAFCIDYVNCVSLLVQSEYIKESRTHVFRTEKVKDPYILIENKKRNVFEEENRMGFDCSELMRIEFEKRKVEEPYKNMEEYSAGIPQSHYQWVDKCIYFDFDKHSRIVISENVFNHFTVCMKKIENDLALISLCSVLVSTVESYQKQQYFESIINAWSIIEFFINKDWVEAQKNLKENGRMAKKRDEIMNGKDYTASIKTNMLEVMGIIPIEVYNMMNIVRSSRNYIVHDFCYSVYKNEKRTIEDILTSCIKSFEIIQYYIKKYFDIDIEINNSICCSNID